MHHFLSFSPTFFFLFSNERKMLSAFAGILEKALRLFTSRRIFDTTWLINQIQLRSPGFEPGFVAWKATVLPLDYERLLCEYDAFLFICYEGLKAPPVLSLGVKHLSFFLRKKGALGRLQSYH
jgi:hypothetical protein